MVVDAIRKALEKMDRRYCKLSTLDYSDLKRIGPSKRILSEEKYLERAFAKVKFQILSFITFGLFGEDIVFIYMGV